MINAAWTRSCSRLAASVLVGACVLLPAAAHEVDPEHYRQMLESAQVEYPSLEQDIAALRNFHQPAKQAAMRLVERGDEIVPLLINAMLAPEANDKQRQQLIDLLGQIGDERAIGPMIELADAHPEWGGARRQILLALTHLPQTEASFEFAERMAEHENPITRRTAIVYFGELRDPRGRKFVDVFVEDPDLDNRAVGLYLAARLGDTSVKGAIVELLGLPAPWSLRGFLLTGLADVADATEIERITPAYLREGEEYRSALRLARFRTGSLEERTELTRKMLRSHNREEKLQATHFILEQQGTDGLTRLLGLDIAPHVRAVARHELRRAGYRVIQRGQRISLERKPGR